MTSSMEGNAAYSPDGRKIAFGSGRGGTLNIWVSNSDGSNPLQLTNFRRHAGTPRWSPDGKKIVFDSIDSGNLDIYMIDAEGGIPRPLTRETTSELLPSWSRDGRWIYFQSDRSGSLQMWKMPAEGGAAVQVTKNGGYVGEESYDGKYLYYSQSLGSGIWRVPVEGGEETEVIRPPISWPNWTLAGDGIYYAVRERLRHKDTIYFHDFKSGHAEELYSYEGPDSHHWLAVSPDEQWILFTGYPPETSELVLVENFR
jgi:Tol biopolymer transport system component